ncbi:MAG: hypothetical protein WCA95_03845 [Opitutaceae bacterium]
MRNLSDTNAQSRDEFIPNFNNPKRRKIHHGQEKSGKEDGEKETGEVEVEEKEVISVVATKTGKVGQATHADFF